MKRIQHLKKQNKNNMSTVALAKQKQSKSFFIKLIHEYSLEGKSNAFIVKNFYDNYKLPTTTCYTYLREESSKISQQFESQASKMRECIVYKLLNIMDTTKDNWEVMRATEQMIKIFGLNASEKIDISNTISDRRMIEFTTATVEEKKDDEV